MQKYGAWRRRNLWRQGDEKMRLRSKQKDLGYKKLHMMPGDRKSTLVLTRWEAAELKSRVHWLMLV